MKQSFLFTLLLVGCGTATPINITEPVILNTINVTVPPAIANTVKEDCNNKSVEKPIKPYLPNINGNMTDDEINLILIDHIDDLNKHIKSLEKLID